MTRRADQRWARARRERERVRDVASRGLITQTLFDDDADGRLSRSRRRASTLGIDAEVLPELMD